jgi:hypothetical protein
LAVEHHEEDAKVKVDTERDQRYYVFRVADRVAVDALQQNPYGDLVAARRSQRDRSVLCIAAINALKIK